MGTSKERDYAIKLRRKGLSYTEILKRTGLKSKGTLSHWFKDLKLSNEEQLRLEQNNDIAHKRGLFKANIERTERIRRENSQSYNDGKNYIKSCNNILAIIGTSLYWGEGTKSENMKSVSLRFSNSDYRMAKIFVKFLTEILNIKKDKIRAGIHIYSTINPNAAREFWSNHTGLPQNRFYIVNQVSRASNNLRPFNSLPNGTVVIRVNNRMVFFKVKGMIDGMIEKYS